jgi:DNA sulfur modification protein DndE
MIPLDNNLEINWRTFAGDYSDLHLLALKQRCYEDQLDVSKKEVLAEQLRLHMHRGISYLEGDPKLKKD